MVSKSEVNFTYNNCSTELSAAIRGRWEPITEPRESGGRSRAPVVGPPNHQPAVATDTLPHSRPPVNYKELQQNRLASTGTANAGRKRPVPAP